MSTKKTTTKQPESDQQPVADINFLKAKVYDLLVLREQATAYIQRLDAEMAEVNKRISEKQKPEG